MISMETRDIIMRNAEVSREVLFLPDVYSSYLCMQRLNSAIIYERDFTYQYFGFKTLERSYLLKIDKRGVFLGAICAYRLSPTPLQWLNDLNTCSCEWLWVFTGKT